MDGDRKAPDVLPDLSVPTSAVCQDKLWTRDHREEMSHLKNRVAGFIERVVRRKETHVFVVSHGVFMETAVRQLASTCPG